MIGYVSPRHKVFLLWSEETTLAGWPRSPGGAALGGPAASELLTAQRLRLSHLDCRWLLTLFVAPHYALRSAVGEDIGTLAAGDGLTTTDAEIERYRDYIDLRRVYGGEWPVPALADYLNIVKEMSGGVEEDSAQAIWRAAIEKYECEREKKRLVALSKDRRLHDPKGEPLDEVCL